MYLQSRARAILRSLPGQPRGWLAWLWAVLAGVTVISAAVLAAAMLFPVHWRWVGPLGWTALLFPLHLLVPVPLLGGLAYLAARCRAPLGALLFAVATALVALMAAVPGLGVWWAARSLDVSLSLVDYLEHGTRWNVGGPVRERTVSYGRAEDGTSLELDVWDTGKGRRGPLRPAIVLVHGGAWTEGTRSNLPGWNRWLNSLGYEVFDIEYRMPPPARWLDEVADVKSAIGWVAANSAQHHVDPARISVMGSSAGANLALLAAYSMGDARLPASTNVAPVELRSVVNLYGPTDLELLHRDTPHAEYIQAKLAAYLGGGPAEYPERYRLVSPLAHVVSGVPPTLTLTGASDRLVPPEHARLLDRALARAGVPHELYVLPVTDHAFDVNFGGLATQVARVKIAAFLARHAGGAGH